MILCHRLVPPSTVILKQALFQSVIKRFSSIISVFKTKSANLVFPSNISSALFQDELLKLVNADQIKHVTVISKFKFQQYRNFCSDMETKASNIKWDYYANSNDIVGTDLPCVILFGIPLVEHWASYISRARNKLIIVTGETFPRYYF